MPRTSILLALVALFVAACPAAALASKPRVLHVACAKKHSGRLRYVTVARGCRRLERPVRFTQRAAIPVCVGARGVVRRARRCGVRRQLVLPAERRRVLCVNRRTRLMRAGRCRRRRDFKVVVMGRPSDARPVAPPVVPDTPAPSPPTTTGAEPSPTVTVPVTVTPPPPVDVVPVDTPPVARADEATTDEDTAVVVRVLDNDTGVDVADLDTTGTTGAVALNPDGTVTYDPRERFDALGETELATDTFTYRTRDEHGRSEPVTVFLTVTGVDDASVLDVEDSTLAYDTGADPVAVSPSLTVTDVDGPAISRARVTVAGGEGRLEFTDRDGIAGAWDEAAGALLLSGEAPIETYEAALRTVAFSADALVPSGTRRVEFAVAGRSAGRDVAVTHVNLAPAAGPDSYDGAVGNTELEVDTSVLDNDDDVDGPRSELTATAASPTPSGARVAMRPDGTFAYVPPVGFTGDDSFEYTLHDNDPAHPRRATGIVTVHVGGPMTWFVDAAAAAGGDGRSDSPFASLAPLSTGGSADALDGAGDRILLAAGTYGEGIVLESGQKLVGQGAVNAVIDATGSPAVTLANGVDVQHVDLRATGAPAVSGTGVGNATIAAPSTISGSGGGVTLDGGAGTITIGSTITTTGGNSVSIQNRTGGTVSFQGTVADTGAGIQLRANTGAALAFGNRLTLPSFTATGGGTVNAVGLGSTTRGIDIRDTTIGSGGVRFQSVSATSIVLNATGRSGGLLISGGTAGTISLTDTSKVSLSNLRAAGITGSAVHGFTLSGSTVTGAVALDDVDGAVTVTGDYAASLAVRTTGAITRAIVSNNATNGAMTFNVSASGVMTVASIRANSADSIDLSGDGAYGTPAESPGVGSDLVTVTQNTAPITATLSRGNLAITENTAPGIAIDASGAGAAAFEVAANDVDGPQGIGLTTSAGTVDAELVRNALRGSGSLGVQAGPNTRVRLAANTFSAGDVQLSGDPLCADVTLNVAARILLSTTHGFGIAGLTPDPSNATVARAYVSGVNPDTPTTTVTGPQFTSCELPY